jgi:hypothetical protein
MTTLTTWRLLSQDDSDTRLNHGPVQTNDGNAHPQLSFEASHTKFAAKMHPVPTTEDCRRHSGCDPGQSASSYHSGTSSVIFALQGARCSRVFIKVDACVYAWKAIQRQVSQLCCSLAKATRSSIKKSDSPALPTSLSNDKRNA